MEKDQSVIKQFYAGKSVFLTGASGFLGLILIDKLLRSCPDLRKIYILLRPRRGKDPHQRLKEMFENPVFGPLKKVDPNFFQRIGLIVGDCDQPKLGISDQDWELLVNEVNIVIHGAANVRFDVTLKKQTNSHVRAIEDIIQLSRDLKQLYALVHVSSFYTNCQNSYIEETFYPPPMKRDNLYKLFDILDDQHLDLLTPSLVEKYRNTYLYTKAIAEDVLQENAKDLPTVMIRPAILMPTNQDPIPGWINSMFGICGISLGASMGLLRTVCVKHDTVACLVPCDFTVNLIIAAAWEVANSPKSDSIKIFNHAGSKKNLLTWGDYIRFLKNYKWQALPLKHYWYFIAVVVADINLWKKISFFLHIIPGYFIDLILLLIGKKPIAVKGYRKLETLIKVTCYFCTTTWDFDDSNVVRLWNNLGGSDRSLFKFILDDLDWDSYMIRSMLAGRFYFHNETLETLNKARLKQVLFMILHYSLVFLFLYQIYRLIYYFIF